MVNQRSTAPLVAIVMGSDSDLPVMEEAARTLARFDIPYEMTIASAHRSPQRLHDLATGAAARGIRIVIAGAGGAAHLPGVIAALTPLPVIGVPVEGAHLGGLDSLLSMVQMPGGVPVAVMAIGKAGARNAAIFAAQILAVGDSRLMEAVRVHKAALARQVEEKAASLRPSTELRTGQE